MGIEIERKFLLTGSSWKQLASGTSYRQGYLSSVKERTVRVRTIDDNGFLTITKPCDRQQRRLWSGVPDCRRR